MLCGFCAERREFGHLALDALRFLGQCENENRARTGAGFHPDVSPVPLHNTLADGQADAGAWNLFAVQPLEDAKDTLAILRGNSDSVVADAEAPVRIRGLHRNM